jgi:hypothetical protein
VLLVNERDSLAIFGQSPPIQGTSLQNLEIPLVIDDNRLVPDSTIGISGDFIRIRIPYSCRLPFRKRFLQTYRRNPRRQSIRDDIQRTAD